MVCDYTVEAGEHVDSIKWYKDGHEFYRIVPNANREQDRVVDFKTTGVSLDKQKSGVSVRRKGILFPGWEMPADREQSIFLILYLMAQRVFAKVLLPLPPESVIDRTAAEGKEKAIWPTGFLVGVRSRKGEQGSGKSMNHAN